MDKQMVRPVVPVNDGAFFPLAVDSTLQRVFKIYKKIQLVATMARDRKMRFFVAQTLLEAASFHGTREDTRMDTNGSRIPATWPCLEIPI
jgi:hypothetical protein